MGRNAKASSSKLPTTNGKKDKSARKPIARKPEPEPETESEEEELDEDDLLDEPEEAEGIAQYAPDDWDGEGQSDSGSDDGSERSDSEAGSASESEDDGQDDLRKLQDNLRSMPLSTLMKAQRSLNPQTEESDESGSEAESGSSTIKAKRLAEAKKRLAEMQRRKGKAGGIAVPALDLEDEEGSEDEFEDMRQSRGGSHGEKERKERVKRDNKHAPTAMSTKKQVSRTRLVVEGIPKMDRRDPRFDTMSSSSIDPHLASQSYSFLPKILKDDLSALRTAVQMAQKAERTCPLAQKPARVAEREMLEMQLGKLRTKIERGEREAKEREVLAGAKREENNKRKEGKGAWYMKKNEQKELLLKARFEHLNEQGGQRAVKKAIEKKRKKTASKEKKSRPFARGQGQGGPGVGGGGGEGAKRRRVA